MDNEIYIKPPEGVETDSKCFKLNRALYGLRNAPKCWNTKFNEVMLKLKFNRSNHDYCLYVKDNVYLILFVDDALITGPDEHVSKLLKELHKQINVKITNKVSNFIGMEIIELENGLKITQNKIISRLLKKFGMVNCRPANTPQWKQTFISIMTKR